MPHELCGFPPWLVGTQTISSPESWKCSSCSLLLVPSLALGSSLTCTHWSVPSWNIWGRLPERLQSLLSLCTTLLSLVLFSVNSSHIGFPEFLPLDCQGQLGSHSLLYRLKIFSRQYATATGGLTLFLYPLSGISVLWCLMSNIWKLPFTRLDWFLSCFSQGGKSSTCYSILAGSRSLTIFCQRICWG